MLKYFLQCVNIRMSSAEDCKSQNCSQHECKMCTHTRTMYKCVCLFGEAPKHWSWIKAWRHKTIEVAHVMEYCKCTRDHVIHTGWSSARSIRIVYLCWTVSNTRETTMKELSILVRVIVVLVICASTCPIRLNLVLHKVFKSYCCK